MNNRFVLNFDLELPEQRQPADGATAVDRRAVALAEAVIAQVLPPLASGAGVERNRLAGALLAELGYDLGRSHPPDAAMDALAAATERLRDAIVGRRGAALPTATVRGPTRLQ